MDFIDSMMDSEDGCPVDTSQCFRQASSCHLPTSMDRRFDPALVCIPASELPFLPDILHNITHGRLQYLYISSKLPNHHQDYYTLST